MKLPDNRYTVEREWCGHKTMRYVARFCGKWVSQHETRDAAVKACQEHARVRQEVSP